MAKEPETAAKPAIKKTASKSKAKAKPKAKTTTKAATKTTPRTRKKKTTSNKADAPKARETLSLKSNSEQVSDRSQDNDQAKTDKPDGQLQAKPEDVIALDDKSHEHLSDKDGDSQIDEAEAAKGGSKFSLPKGGFGTTALPTKAPDDTHLKWIYGGALLGGSILILFGKIFFNVPSIAITIIAGVVIVAYGIYAGFSQRHQRMRMDRIGDNCYYLGLTYTLCSLIAALIVLNNSGEIGRTLLENFGIALISTAVGVIMRMMLMQFRTELDDVETEARLRLAEASEDLRQQLHRVQADFGTVRESMSMNLERAQTEMIEAIKLQTERMSGVFGNSLDAVESRVKTSDEIMGNFETRFKDLGEYTTALGQAAQALSERMNNVHANPDLLQSSLRSLSGSISEISDRFDQVAEKVSLQAQTGHEAANVLERLEQSLQRISEVVENMEDSVRMQKLTVKEGQANLEAHTAAMREYTGKAQIEGEQMREATTRVYESLSQLANLVVDGVNRGKR